MGVGVTNTSRANLNSLGKQSAAGVLSLSHSIHGTRQSATNTNRHEVAPSIHLAKLRSIMQSAPRRTQICCRAPPGHTKWSESSCVLILKGPASEIPGTSPHAAPIVISHKIKGHAPAQKLSPHWQEKCAARPLGLYDWSNKRLRKTVARIRTRLPYLIRRFCSDKSTCLTWLAARPAARAN